MTSKRRKRNARSSPSSRSRGKRYSPAELFMAGIGLLLIVLFVVIVVSSLFE